MYSTTTFEPRDILIKADTSIILVKTTAQSQPFIFCCWWYLNSRLCLHMQQHVLYSWIKRDQLDVTCFIISLFNAQLVLDVKASNLRSLRLICWVISWVVLLWFDVRWCYFVVWLWWCGIRMQAEALVPQPAYGYHTTHRTQSNTTHE